MWAPPGEGHIHKHGRRGPNCEFKSSLVPLPIKTEVLPECVVLRQETQPCGAQTLEQLFFPKCRRPTRLILTDFRILCAYAIKRQAAITKCLEL